MKIIVFFMLLACAGFADAQSCRKVTTVARPIQTYSTTYQYPVVVKEFVEVVTPIAVPVLVPAFQYQYVPPCAVAPVAAAPVTPHQIGPGGVQFNGQKVNTTDSDHIRQLAKAILAEMGKQSEGEQQDDGPPMAVSDFGQPVHFLTTLSNRCAGCHTGPSSKGGVQIFTSPGQFNLSVDRQRLVKAAEDGRMPPQAVNDPNFRLTPNEVAGLRVGLNVR